MAVKEKRVESSGDEIEWNVENEIQLFFAMNGHKPVGVNKYFHMICIWEKFRSAIHKNVSLKMIWDHLESMYDLMALDDMEDLPFPSQEIDFSLPESEFQELAKPRNKKEEPEVKEAGNTRDQKSTKEGEKKKEEPKKYTKSEPDTKKDKLRDNKDPRKEHKSSKGRSKGKDELEDTASNGKKERKDSESSRESLKRSSKRPTRQSADSSSKASSSPRDTPPPKRRRI